MEDKEPSTVDAKTQTKVYDVSSCSMFSQYETNVDMKLLTNMEYIGGGLGIHGQGVIRGGTKTTIRRFGIQSRGDWRVLKVR